MPRAAGQIDLSKNEAILDAAEAVLCERGMAAPIETIARRALVSKQTIYNHYGCKADLVRALISRRAAHMTEALSSGERALDPQTALATFGAALLQVVSSEYSQSLWRMMANNTDPSDRAFAAQLFRVGPMAVRERLTEYLRKMSVSGQLDMPDPAQAAEFFIGMVIGQSQVRLMSHVPMALTPDSILRMTNEAAARLLRAYAPVRRQG